MTLWETVFAGCGKDLCFSTGCKCCFPSAEWPVMHISIQGREGVPRRRYEQQNRPAAHQGLAQGTREADSRQKRAHGALLRLTGRSAERGAVTQGCFSSY